MKRRVRNLLLLSGTLLIAVALGFGVVQFITGPTFQLESIYVRSSPDIFPDRSVFQVRANVIFLSTTSFAEKIVRASPYIKAARVTKQFPSSLLVEIEERLPVATFRLEGTPWFVDGESVLLPGIPRLFEKELPIVTCLVAVDAGGQVSDQKLRVAFEVAHDLATDGTSKLTEIGCEESTGALIMLIDDVLVRMSADKGRQELSPALLFLFKQFRIEGKRPKTVDLRFEKPVLTP